MKMAMKRIIQISFVLSLFMSCTAVAQTENRNTAPGWNTVVNEAHDIAVIAREKWLKEKEKTRRRGGLPE